MKFLESDLEKIIMETGIEKLYGRGLHIEGTRKLKRQVYIGNYGTADMVGYSTEPDTYWKEGEIRLNDWNKTITVYELKKDKISLSSIAQCLQYVRGVQDYFQHTGRDIDNYYWEAVLIGRRVDLNSVTSYFPDLFRASYKGSCSIRMFEYDFDINGLFFKEVEGYFLTKKGFSNGK